MDFTQIDKGFAPGMNLNKPCVRQVIPGNAIKAVSAVGNAGSAATVATVVGSAVMQTVMSGCLAQVWEMINGMHFIIHLPAVNVNFPSNAFIVIEKIIMVATFDIPYVSMESIGSVYTLPDSEDEILTEESQKNIKSSLE